VQEQGQNALFIVDSWPYQGEAVADQVASIPFPIDMGILGYRVCFVGADRAAELARVNTLDQLRHFTQGTGTGWQDAVILRHGGLTVHEVDNYESLFRMVARGRIDLFCRGANEILPEWQSHQGKVAGLTVDRHLALFYPRVLRAVCNWPGRMVPSSGSGVTTSSPRWCLPIWGLARSSGSATRCYSRRVLTIAPTFTIRRRMISVHCPEPGYQVHRL